MVSGNDECPNPAIAFTAAGSVNRRPSTPAQVDRHDVRRVLAGLVTLGALDEEEVASVVPWFADRWTSSSNAPENG
jgi:hypothetical protein